MREKGEEERKGREMVREGRGRRRKGKGKGKYVYGEVLRVSDVDVCVECVLCVLIT